MSTVPTDATTWAVLKIILGLIGNGIRISIQTFIATKINFIKSIKREFAKWKITIIGGSQNEHMHNLKSIYKMVVVRISMISLSKYVKPINK